MTNKLKATEGDWVVDDSYSTMLCITSGDNFVCEIDADYCFDIHGTSPTDEQKANAHLIAQAKNMYEMLDELKSSFEQEYSAYSVAQANNIDNLLAKCRGE